MAEPSPRFREVFFEVYAASPRPGPRDRAARALSLCRNLPVPPSILELGCGGQTLSFADEFFVLQKPA